MKISDFKALSFDCYGTLIDWESGIISAFTPWLVKSRLKLDPVELLCSFAKHEAWIEENRPWLLYPDILARTFQNIAIEYGVHATDHDARKFANSVPSWPAFADSNEALVRLQRHFKLVILSNVDRKSFIGSSKRLGVTFELVLTAQDIGSYKPSLWNFERLLGEVQHLGITRDQLLHVAQSLFHDHQPAKTLGLSTVWINRRQGKDGWGATPPCDLEIMPDWEFSTLGALADEVERESGLQ